MCGVSYALPEQVDDCYNNDYRRLLSIQWFNSEAVRVGAHDDYERLMLYALDGRFFWYVTGDALRSRVCQGGYTVDDVDLSTGGPIFEKRVLHLRDVRRGVESCLFSGQSIDPELDMHLWTYRTDVEVD